MFIQAPGLQVSQRHGFIPDFGAKKTLSRSRHSITVGGFHAYRLRVLKKTGLPSFADIFPGRFQHPKRKLRPQVRFPFPTMGLGANGGLRGLDEKRKPPLQNYCWK